MAAAPTPYTALKVYRATVTKAERLNEHVARITIGGGDLPEFEPISPDQFIYVFVNKPGETDPPVERDFSWDQWRELPEEERPIGRYYTVRRHDPATHEITMDFVLHGDGPMTTWGARAQPGEDVAIWGPRTAYAAPAAGVTQLLFADETGLPALGAILESLAPGARARAFVEIPGPSAEQAIESRGEVEITWLHRNGAAAGQNDLLIEAARAMPFPEGEVYAWAGGEFRAMRDLRRFFKERGLPASSVSVLAYWRHQAHDLEEDAE